MADQYAASLMHVDWIRWFEKIKSTIETIGLSAATSAAGKFVMEGTANAAFPNAQFTGLLSTGLLLPAPLILFFAATWVHQPAGFWRWFG